MDLRIEPGLSDPFDPIFWAYEPHALFQIKQQVFGTFPDHSQGPSPGQPVAGFYKRYQMDWRVGWLREKGRTQER